MIYTVNYVLFSHRLHGLGDERPVIVLNVASELLGPQYAEDVLYFRERRLDRVEVWRIADVVDVSEA